MATRSKTRTPAALKPDSEGILLNYDPFRVFIMGEDIMPEDETDRYLVDTDESRVEIDSLFLDDIANRGILQPGEIIVHKGKPFVKDGRRRVRAARQATLFLRESDPKAKAVVFPCIMDEGAVDANTLSDSIAYNSFARGYGDMAQARQGQLLLAAGLSKSAVARSINMSRGTLDNRLSLLNLIPEAQVMIERGKLDTMAGIEMSSLSIEDQKAALDKTTKVAALTGSTRGQRAAVKVEKAAKTGEPAADPKPDPKSDSRVGPWRVGLTAKVLGTEAIKKVNPLVVAALRVLAGLAPASEAGLEAALVEARGAPKAKEPTNKPESKDKAPAVGDGSGVNQADDAAA